MASSSRRPPRAKPARAITPDLARMAETQIGVSGLVQYAGRLYDEWLPDLQGPRGRRVYREMADQDPVIGAVLFAIEMLVRQVEWRVVPSDDTDAGKAAADFINECRLDMQVTWEDTLAEILTMLVYGWSLHEIVYKQRPDGRIGWYWWAVRGQETLDRWEFDPWGRVLGMWQLGPPDFVFHFIPMAKALLFRPTVRRSSPEGRSLLRNCYRPYYFKKHIEVIEGIGIERDLAGMPVIWGPPELFSKTATTDDQAMLTTLQNLVTNIKRDEQEGVVMPLAYDDKGNPLYKLELLSAGGARQFDTDKVVARHDQRIAMTVMADFILLGHENVGTQALAGTKSNLFTTALSALLDSICAVVNKDAIGRLLRLNGVHAADTAPPRLEHGDVESADLDALGTFLTALAGVGVPLDIRPDGPLVKALMKAADLPAPAEDIDLDDLVEQQRKLSEAKKPPLPLAMPPQQNDPNGQGGPNGAQSTAKARATRGRASSAQSRVNA